MTFQDDMQQNIQMSLDFAMGSTGEAQKARREETESSRTGYRTDGPARSDRVMEEVCEPANLKEALQRVQVNKGSAGIDGMTVSQLPVCLRQHWPVIREQLLDGTYKPQPVRKVDIPKPVGGLRQLGIPTVLDRFIQQAVMQVLQRRWDRTFSDLQLRFSTGTVCASGCRPGAAVYRGGLRLGGRSRPGEVL